MRKIKRIIIHCSDSTFGDTKLIRKWHVDENGWRDVGYHQIILNGKINNKSYHIEKDGVVEAGRNLNHDTDIEWKEIGAHVKGMNKDSIGICLIGKDKFTPKQFESLAYILFYWKKVIPGVSIHGHCEFSIKTCPNFDVKRLIAFLNEISMLPEIQYYLKDYIG